MDHHFDIKVTSPAHWSRVDIISFVFMVTEKSPSMCLKFNPFDSLPDEVILVVFRHLLNDAPTIGALLRTCKLFNRIINDKLIYEFTVAYPEIAASGNFCTDHNTKKHKKWNTLELPKRARTNNSTPASDEHARKLCKSRHCLGGGCLQIRRKACLGFVRFRCLSLRCLNLDSCCVDAIMDEKDNLRTISVLRLYRCEMNAMALHTILDLLPNVSRIFITDIFNSSYTTTASQTQLKTRTIDSLQLNTLLSGPCMYTGCFDYIKMKIAAREIQFTNLQDPPWLIDYLTRHGSVVERCVFNFHHISYIVNWPTPPTEFFAFLDNSRLTWSWSNVASVKRVGTLKWMLFWLRRVTNLSLCSTWRATTSFPF